MFTSDFCPVFLTMLFKGLVTLACISCVISTVVAEPIKLQYSKMAKIIMVICRITLIIYCMFYMIIKIVINSVVIVNCGIVQYGGPQGGLVSSGGWHA